MKKLLLGTFLCAVSTYASADAYSVTSAYTIEDELSGELEFVIDDGKTATFSDGQLNEFSVTVSDLGNDQVLLTYVFSADTDDSTVNSESEVIVDLNKEVVLTMDYSEFHFMIKRS